MSSVGSWVAAWQIRWDRVRDEPAWWLGGVSVALVLCAAYSASVGAARIPTTSLPEVLTSTEHPMHAVLWSVRLPRVVGSALIGAALALSGVCMQASVRNPLADPGLLGVTTSAGLGAMLAILFVPQYGWMLPLCAFAGGLVGLAIVLGMMGVGGRSIGPLRVILCGIALQAVFFALIALLTFFFADRAPAFAAFTVGSLTGTTWDELAQVSLPFLVGIAIAWRLHDTLDLLHLDDDTAAGLGLSVGKARVGVATVAALLASTSVAIAGLVNFVGLIVPNVARIAVGPSHRVLVPIAAIGGALLSVFADVVARTIAEPLELPVGALLALAGGPTLVWVLWSRIP